MKKPSLLPMIVASLICGLCLGVVGFHYWEMTRFSPPPQPPLIAEPAVIDFGNVQGQDVVQGTSSINNTTKKPIRILHVVVSCACGNIKLREGELLPGEATELSVDWDLRGRTGNTAASLAIVYVMDEDTQQVLTVKLKANVVLDTDHLAAT